MTSYFSKIKANIPWTRVLLILSLVFLLAWLSWTPAGLMGKADAIGYAVCHRIDLRSFHLGDRQMPLCARCTGQYLGAMVSMIYLAIFRPRRTGRPPWVVIAVLVLFAVFYALDGLNSYIHLIPQLSRFYLYPPGNTLRLLSGTGIGLGMGVLVSPAFNSTVWKRNDPRPIIEGPLDFGALLGIALLVDLLVLSGIPLLLYPLALFSAAWVLVLLTLIYTMVVVMVAKKENAYQNFREMTGMVLIGFIIALAQVAILDILRYLLTGTWGGFTFG